MLIRTTAIAVAGWLMFPVRSAPADSKTSAPLVEQCELHGSWIDTAKVREDFRVRLTVRPASDGDHLLGRYDNGAKGTVVLDAHKDQRYWVFSVTATNQRGVLEKHKAIGLARVDPSTREVVVEGDQVWPRERHPRGSFVLRGDCPALLR